MTNLHAAAKNLFRKFRTFAALQKSQKQTIHPCLTIKGVVVLLANMTAIRHPPLYFRNGTNLMSSDFF